MKPMLATDVDLSKLRYPVLVSEKLDGIRAIVKDGIVYGRSLKPIPNPSVQKMFGQAKYNGLDGELICGPANGPRVCDETKSGVMSKSKELHWSDVCFYVFDKFDLELPFKERNEIACDMAMRAPVNVVPVTHVPVTEEQQLLQMEQHYLLNGYEGLMIRDPEGPYKFGRSTVNEGYLLKLKRFQDSEALITGVEPLYQNQNEATLNELGLTHRSSHKENKVAMETMGALQVEDLKTGVFFKIGTGFDQALRAQIWKDRDAMIGQIVKYKFLPVGIKEAPRHPVFLSFRDPIDMGE